MKRTCQGCGVRFYDLQRDPIICPKCATVYDPDAVSRTRRGRSTAAVAKPAPRAPVPELAESPSEAVAPELEEAGLEIAEDGEAEGEDVIEDTEDLPEDDVTEVIETGDEEET
jgi:uncharacterized protein (TIGR02300 family)